MSFLRLEETLLAMSPAEDVTYVLLTYGDNFRGQNAQCVACTCEALTANIVRFYDDESYTADVSLTRPHLDREGQSSCSHISRAS